MQVFWPEVRSSRPKVFCEKGVLRNFAKFTGKHLCQSLFFNKVAGLRPATLIKKRLWHCGFLRILRNFWEKLFLKNTSSGCFWEIKNSFFVEHFLMTNSENIVKYSIVYYISRHRFSCFVFDWYWRNEKSRNSTGVILKEQIYKKGGWFNWLFQIFKTRKIVDVRRVTELLFTRNFQN